MQLCAGLCLLCPREPRCCIHGAAQAGLSGGLAVVITANAACRCTAGQQGLINCRGRIGKRSKTKRNHTWQCVFSLPLGFRFSRAARSVLLPLLRRRHHARLRMPDLPEAEGRGPPGRGASARRSAAARERPAGLLTTPLLQPQALLVCRLGRVPILRAAPAPTACACSRLPCPP